jgi:hypothetical protein
MYFLWPLYFVGFDLSLVLIFWCFLNLSRFKMGRTALVTVLTLEKVHPQNEPPIVDLQNFEMKLKH